ncbi:hypothetical protein K466DRAFT_35287 [Polyporus arcularius HHB13444]|uniref:Uncharacterized protein n=1 Tax=Polyporus arcularius HHB13444 TaxID=1314778 RepID=A0A5C3Q6C3_9APHY|nr:hypothetical protein K466DRAFT_35287 [Polyporus arcularius HHB13444]
MTSLTDRLPLCIVPLPPRVPEGVSVPVRSIPSDRLQHVLDDVTSTPSAKRSTAALRGRVLVLTRRPAHSPPFRALDDVHTPATRVARPFDFWPHTVRLYIPRGPANG